MQNLLISNRVMSEAVWSVIVETSAYKLIDKKEPFFRLMAALEVLRKTADYNTGAIPTSSAWALYSVTCLFQPRLY